MRRIIFRIFVVLTAVILLAVVSVQITLLTEFPRDVVTRALEKQLQLRADIGSVSTGWFGHTTLRNVSLSLPLADKPILHVDQLIVRHTWLFPLIFGQDLTIHRLEFDQPTLRIARGNDGRWNFQQIAQSLGSGKDNSGGGSSPILLPAIKMTDGKLEIDDGVRQATLEPLNFTGEPDGLLSWKADLTIADRVKLDGRVAPGGDWEHRASIDFKDVADWMQPWVKLPADLAANAHWHGRLTTSGFQGRLDAATVHAAGCTVAGALDIVQSGQAVDLRPDNVRFTTPMRALHQFAATSGDMRYQNNVIRAQSLQLAAYGGPASVSGYYDLANRMGEMSAAWDQLALPGKIIHGGNLSVKILRPFPTQAVVEGSLISYATTPQGPWRASLHFGGQDETSSEFSWHVNATELDWNRRNPIRLDGLQALGSIRHPAAGPATIILASLQLPDKQAIDGSGFFNMVDRSWVLKVSGNRFPLQLIQNHSIGFDLDAAGNTSAVTLNQFTLTQAQTIVSASGSYRFGIPKPVAATIVVTGSPAAQDEPGERPIVEGTMRGNAQMEGTILPLDLDLKGRLYGKKVRVASRDIGDVALRVTGTVNPDHAQLETERLRVLGGDWSLRTTYAFPDELLDCDLRVSGLPLQNICRAADTNMVHGTLAGEWDAYFLKFPYNPRNIRLSGQAWIHDLSCGDFTADEVHYTASMEDGLLSIDPIIITRGNGRGAGSIRWDIDQPRRFEGAISLTGWPMQSGSALEILQFDVPSLAVVLPGESSGLTAATPLQIDADRVHAKMLLMYNAQPYGNFSLDASIGGGLASVTDLHGSILDAPVSATAQIDLANPLQSHGSFSFDKLDAARLATLFPQAKGLSGTLHGAGSMAPADFAHPLEPLTVHFHTAFDKGRYRGLPIGDFNLNGLMNTSRIVLDDRPGHDSTLDIADGKVRLWGRAGHPADGVFSSQLELQLRDLDLNEIVHCANARAAPTPGKIGGKIMLLYNHSLNGDASGTIASAATTQDAEHPALRELMHNLYGEASLNLRGSDVATIPIFSDLYTIFSLGLGGGGPIGRGTLEARLEGGTLFISNVHYFNRGTDALFEMISPNMWDFPNNEVLGNAVASLQPLAAVRLPLVTDVQTALDALQGNFRSLRISGTWNNMRRTPIALSNLAKEMQDLLIGNINSNEDYQPADISPEP